ncbi:hypothetical protein JCM11251_004922 [Rhodosporidiobolus azoricus]
MQNPEIAALQTSFQDSDLGSLVDQSAQLALKNKEVDEYQARWTATLRPPHVLVKFCLSPHF